MKKKVFTIGLAALLVAGTISIALSRGYGRRGGGFGPGLGYGPGMANWEKAGLNLTQEQMEKLQSLRTDFDKEMLTLRNEIQTKALELRQLWLADELDEDTIVAKSMEVSTLQNQLQEEMIHHRLNVAKVLTKEQRTQFSHAAGYCGHGYQYGSVGQHRYGHGGHFGMGRVHRWNR